MSVASDQEAARAKDILNAIDRNLRRAIELRSFYERCAFTEDIPQQFSSNDRIATGFAAVRDAIFFELTLTLMRVHDVSRDKDSSSLPVLMELLNDAGLWTYCLEQARRWFTTNKVATDEPLESSEELTEAELQRGEKNAATVHAALCKAHRLHRSLSGSHLVGRLRGWRDQVYAHTAERVTVQPAKYRHAIELVDKTIEIVEPLMLAVHGVYADYTGLINFTRSTANYFWKHCARLD